MLDDLIAATNRVLPEAPYPQRAGFIQTAPWLALLLAALGLLFGTIFLYYLLQCYSEFGRRYQR